MNLHDRRAHAAQPSGRAPRLLLLTIIFITIVCFEAHAETFDVPGTSGNGWLDTRLDLAPGTLVRLAASGQVDVGAGWGVHGPEGTTHFADVAGYPAETRFRYGLVARLTESRTNPADELRNDYDYGTTREFCASGGGHLWLTVNDNHAVNNTGQFRVVMTRGRCQPDPVGPSTRLAERFRITINGFACEHPTIDDPTQRDGVDDEVFVQADLSLYNLSGAYNQASVKSAVIGDSNNFSTRIRSGSGYSIFGGNGGINGRDTFPAGGRPWERFSEPRRDRPPLLVWEGELVSSEKALLIIPSIWEWDGDAPVFLRYVLSFVYLGIYWTNHHHLLQVVDHVSGGVLWANLHLLFWLSLVPFVTAWMGENRFAPVPVAVYGGVLLCAALAYFILTRTLLRIHSRDSTLATALGRDFKGKISIVMNVSGIGLAFVRPWLACALYVAVAILWLAPDRRIEKRIV